MTAKEELEKIILDTCEKELNENIGFMLSKREVSIFVDAILSAGFVRKEDEPPQQKKVSVEELEETVWSVIEKAVTEDKSIRNKDELFELLAKIKLSEKISQSISDLQLVRGVSKEEINEAVDKAIQSVDLNSYCMKLGFPARTFHYKNAIVQAIHSLIYGKEK